MQPFVPSPRATNWLVAIGFLSIGYAMYVRYLVVEQSSVGIACDGGLATLTCQVRHVATRLFTNQVFGFAALAFSVLNFVRPSVSLFAIALALTGLGIVLYNTALSSLAAALLIVSLARPIVAEEE